MLMRINSIPIRTQRK